MYLSIIIFPFLGSILSGFLGRKIGVMGAQWISCFSLFLSAISSTIAFYEVGFKGNPTLITIGNWIDSEILSVSWDFSFDQLSVVFCIMITYITFLIMVYTIYYLEGGPHIQRFFSYLAAFAGFMLLLVNGGNYFVMFVGWEGIGIISFLLISYYFTRIQATKAAILAFTMNRLGDMILSIGFFALIALFGTVDYSMVFNLAPYFNEDAITIISLLLFGGACAKSAQFPLHTWLPGSMEAPTPVSALLHAATLVTAGIFLLLRSSPILNYSSDALLIITLIGSLTAFIAGTTALVQNDLKRIIAFSTISQLGYMMIAIGLAQWNIALFHTVLHAFFKALLFLSAGVIIHSLNDEQDIRRMGGLIKFLPFTYSVLLIGTIALLGLPWLSGFYSKDLILELSYGKYQFSGFFAFILGSITAFFTAFYSTRLINLVFFTLPNTKRDIYLNIHSEKYIIIIPLSILSLFAIFLGFIGSDIVSMGSDFFGNSLFYYPNSVYLIEAEFSLPFYIKLLPTFLTLMGIILAFYLYHFGHYFINGFSNLLSHFSLISHSSPNIPYVKYSKEINTTGLNNGIGSENSIKLKNLTNYNQSINKSTNINLNSDFMISNSTNHLLVFNKINFFNLNQLIFKKIYIFLNGKYLLDVVYNKYLISGTLQLGYVVSKILDKGIIELIGPYGLTEGSYFFSGKLSKLDTGIITTYALNITLGLLCLLFLLFSPLFLTYTFSKLLLISIITIYIVLY